MPKEKNPPVRLIKVKVQPRSKFQSLQRKASDRFFIRVVSAPEKGKANQEAAELLAGYLGIPPSQVKVVKGASSRHKLFSVEE
ncbi:MAG: DUF167 domain-containing protein [Acidobacteriota bacterium]